MQSSVHSETEAAAASVDQEQLAHQPGADAVSLILKQAGRTAEEVASLSTLDDADRAAESQFSGTPPTLSSLFGSVNAAEFYAGRFSPSPAVAKVMGDSLEFVLRRKKNGTLLDHEKMLFHDETIAGLAEIGFFGLAIPTEYGGSGAPLGDLGPLLRALTFVHPDLAVMFEVHNFLGPVTPILDFGTEEQKQKYLPKMARGELLGSFALTEPGVGADPSKLSLTARRDGDRYILNGVKWPITNVIYGGICVLVLKLEGEELQPGRDSGMMIFEVPPADTEHFRMKRNNLVAFDYLWNARFRLMDYELPVDCLLGPPGKGLAQAFSSLAKGRGGICVNSAAKIFKLLAQIILDPSQEEDDAQRGSKNVQERWLDGLSQYVRQTHWRIASYPHLGRTCDLSRLGQPRTGRSLFSPGSQRCAGRNAGHDRQGLRHQGTAADRHQCLSDSGRPIRSHAMSGGRRCVRERGEDSRPMGKPGP